MKIELPLPETPNDAGKLTKASAEPDATEKAIHKPAPEPAAKDDKKPDEQSPEAKPGVADTLQIKPPEKVDFAAVAKEFQDNNGALTEQTVKRLESQGITKDIIETFIEGQKARAQLTRSALAQAVGGEETLNSTLAWASTGLQPDEITTYNTLLKSSDVAAQKLALQALKARMDSALGTEGTRVVAEGTPGTRGVKPYASWAEVQKDMRSAEYKTDKAFQARVAKRLEVSEL